MMPGGFHRREGFKEEKREVREPNTLLLHAGVRLLPLIKYKKRESRLDLEVSLSEQARAFCSNYR